jgi:hypothetical protein
VAWGELDARAAFVVRKSLINPKDAAAHLELGRLLLPLPGGQEWAEKAFALALKLDAGLEGDVEQLRATATKMGEMLKNVGGDDEERTATTKKDDKAEQDGDPPTRPPRTAPTAPARRWSAALTSSSGASRPTRRRRPPLPS